MNRYSMMASLIMSLFLSASAAAGISLDATRLIFSAANGRQGENIGVTSSKQSATPYLVKAQVLSDIEGGQNNVPFVVTPSLFRLEPGMTNQLRIMQTRGGFSQDKESVFYLRVMAMPSGDKRVKDPTTTVGGALTVSTGSVIKLFYRPADLPMTQQQAMKSLIFSRQGAQIKVNNPSPYFITLSALSVGKTSIPLKTKQGKKQNNMLAPFSSQVYVVNTPTDAVTWKAINDYGGVEVFHGQIR